MTELSNLLILPALHTQKMAFWFLFSLLRGASALYVDSDYIEMLTKDQIRNIESDPDHLLLTVIYTSEGRLSQNFADILIKIADEYHNYMRFLTYDCTDDEDMCPPDMIPSLPSVTAYIPTGVNDEGKNVVDKKDFTGEATVESVKDFLRTHSPLLGDYITSSNIERFLGYEDIAKVLLFTNKPKVPIIYKGLSSFYRGQLEFGLVWQNQTDIVNRFHVENFPVLLTIDKENEQSKYDGDIDYEKIKDYLKPLANKRKRSPRNYQNSVAPDLPEFNVKHVAYYNFQSQLDQDSRVALVHFYKEKPHPIWEKVVKKYEGVALLVAMNCNMSHEQKVADQNNVLNYPSIRFYPMNRKRRSWEVSSLSEIQNEINAELKYEVTTLSDDNVANYVQAVRTKGQVGVILLTSQSFPFEYKALSSNHVLLENVQFGLINEYNQRLMERLNVSKFPMLFAFVTINDQGNMKMVEFTGDLKSYKEIYTWLKVQAVPALQEQIPETEKQVDYDDVLLDTYNYKTFNSNCLKKPGVCIIALFEGTPSHRNNINTLRELKKAKSLLDKKKSKVKIGIMDGFCQHEASKALGVSTYPAIVSFDPEKKLASRHYGKFTAEELQKYITQLLKGDAQFYEKRDVPVANRDCIEYYHNLAETTKNSVHLQLANDMLITHELEDRGTSSTKKRKNKKKKKTDL